MAHRKILQLALKLTEKAESILSGKGQSLRLIQMLRTLLLEACFRAEMGVSLEESELAMELYEIADLFEDRRSHNEGRLRLSLILSKLTASQQRRLKAAGDVPKEMIKILHEIAGGDPCLEWEEEPQRRESVMHVLQA